MNRTDSQWTQQARQKGAQLTGPLQLRIKRIADLFIAAERREIDSLNLRTIGCNRSFGECLHKAHHWRQDLIGRAQKLHHAFKSSQRQSCQSPWQIALIGNESGHQIAARIGPKI